MNNQATISTTEVSFKDFLFKDKRNRTILILAGIAIVVQFAVFKYYYPFASFINADSYIYLDTAYLNLDINAYMVGYSRFLRILSVFTSSDTIVVALQYILLHFTALTFLFTVFYFIPLSLITRIIFLCFCILNPLFLHLANYISSDALFLCLSLIWISLLIWNNNRPSVKLIFIHAVIIFIAFTVRYNALFYPFIAAISFCLSKQSLLRKVVGIALPFMLIGLFVLYTGNKYKALTGTWQYSPFSGWQLANNAMYAYRYVDSAERKPVPAKFTDLDNTVRKYFDSTRDVTKYPLEKVQASTVYMWDRNHSPLYQYRESQFKSISKDFDKWATIAPLYGDYGWHIIKSYPLHFAKYFLWPNLKKYYSPPIEFLGSYNMGRDTVSAIAKKWFGYKTKYVNTRTVDFNIHSLDFYLILSGIANTIFLISFISYIYIEGFKRRSPMSTALILIGLFWLMNFGFTVFASSPALRFQSFPILIMTVFGITMVEYIVKAAFKAEDTIKKTHSLIA